MNLHEVISVARLGHFRQLVRPDLCLFLFIVKNQSARVIGDKSRRIRRDSDESGQLGPGRQYVSWIALADEVGAILHAITHDSVKGALNATAPNPVTNADYTRVLGAAVGRPTLLRVPSPVLSLAFGPEMARETVLISQRVRPARLEATGYQFRHPDLAGALDAALGRGGDAATT